MAISMVDDAYLTTLRDSLLARPNLAGVQVFTGPIAEDQGVERLMLATGESGTLTGNLDWRYLGNGRLVDEVRVPCTIWISKAGSGEDVIVATRQRAYAIVQEVVEELRSNGDQGFVHGPQKVFGDAIVETYTTQQGLSGDGYRSCRIEFTILFTAHLTG